MTTTKQLTPLEAIEIAREYAQKIQAETKADDIDAKAIHRLAGNIIWILNEHWNIENRRATHMQIARQQLAELNHPESSESQSWWQRLVGGES